MGGVTFFLSTLLSSEHIALAQEFVSSVVDTSSPEKELIKRRVMFYIQCTLPYGQWELSLA